MQTRMILLFAIGFNTISNSFELSSDQSENLNTSSTPSQSIDNYYEREMENQLFNSKKNSISDTWIGNIIATQMDGFVPFSYENPKCTEDGKIYKEHLIKQDSWAVQMYDSSAKYPGGLLSGITYEMGYYDQCLRAHSKELNIYSAYVLPNVQFQITEENDNMPKVRNNVTSAWRYVKTDGNYSNYTQIIDNINWALCIPDSCNAKDVQISMEELLTPIFKHSNLTIKVSVNPALYTSKRTSDAKHTDGYLIFFCMVLVLILTLNIVGTLYEMNIIGDQHVHWSILKNILLAFSIRKSTTIVFNTQRKNELSVADGLKSYLAICVVIAHRIYHGTFVTATDSPYFMENLMSSPWLNAPVGVELFFVISGFMMYISIINRLNKEKKLNFFYLIFYRMTRLLPAYTIVFLLYMCVLPHIGDGPLWKLYVIPQSEFCRINVWKKFLFIDIYVDGSEKMCIPLTWYVTCEVHFYAIGIILTYAIWKWKNIGLWILGIVFAVSVYMPARTIYTNNLTAIITANVIRGLRSNPFILFVYMKSHQRITTYLIGMAAAHIYTKLKQDNYKISARNKTIGSISSFITFVLSRSSTAYLLLPGIEYNPWHHVLYFTLQRIVAAICVSYFMIVFRLSGFASNSKGYSSKLNNVNFISAMSKLTYSLFLCHTFFQYQSLFSNKTLVHFDWWIMVRYILSDVLLGVFCSLLIVLLFETPCNTIRQKLDDYFQNVKKPNISNSPENDTKMKTK
ncbi:nose resistant to fluoxetine protein 6-like [Adelges cooleyi]|uniref:nose resistant to fluoxetine protein 6-like n=1 Tax=Adelges cooleyi TaxID=133065 RepID=UPI00218056A5|nr:nose resistant to fluoxetine protein 6-like [Adelges cooleyi]